ncbi:MAG TPA: peptidoglycan bridge formation glycyltransferase FemA/FemB family protein [Candidatus Bathyarchaeia archaeon]|nr:peptidoglycan bridge formation glycyltransferase FemA/FemB family protein [Candidatus Bathyarchaeia archaeon]
MIVREVYSEEKEQFNEIVTHPLQSWEWGEFRKTTGVKVVRLGAFEEKKIKNAYQLTIHPLPIPQLNLNVIYFPKGPMPDGTMLSSLKSLGEKQKAIFIRLEPNVGSPVREIPGNAEKKYQPIKDFLTAHGCRPGRPLFTRYTFKIDLEQTEEKLLDAMKEKTRYNIRLAQKKGVEIIEDNSPAAFETYLKLMNETTQRQKFYAHSSEYHRKMWKILNPAGIARLFLAKYQKKVLVAWVLFVFNNVLYYPYGASSREHQEVMPAYTMMWEAIRFGKRNGCKSFDLWGSLGPSPDPKDPWFGWHRFKTGFGGQIVEFLGTYDLVINPQLYYLARLAENLRWKLLRLKSGLSL